MKPLFTFLNFFCNRSAIFQAVILCVAALLLCGCPSGQSSARPANRLKIKGSNTVGEELAPRLIADYKKDHPQSEIDLESKATGYGLAALMVGQCDIAAASRTPIKEEQELAQDRHFEFNDYVIGSYSVAVIVNSGNPVSNLTRDQVRDLFIGKIQNWKEVGGPDAPVHLCIRDPISGTYLGFRELAMDNEQYAPAKTFTNYDGIVGAVARDPAAVGYSSFKASQSPGIRAVDIDGTAPAAEAVRSHKYPYMRVLRLYTNKGSEAPAAVDFIHYVQSDRGQNIVNEMGFVDRIQP